MKAIKRLTSTLLLSGILLQSTFALATPEEEQLDIWLEEKSAITSQWSKRVVAEAFRYDIFKDTNLSKNVDMRLEINREDFTEMAMNYIRLNLTDFKLKQIKERQSITANFIDSDNKNVIEAAELGIVNGIGVNEFAPFKKLTKEEASVILSRIESIIEGESIDVRPLPELRIFNDMDDISEWAKQGVANLVSINAINGNDKGEFKPLNVIKREEAASIISNLITIRNIY